MKILAALVCILLSMSVHAADYSRAAFGVWRDYDGDCRDSRAEALIAASQLPVTMTGCRVTEGLWIDPYTATVIRQASQVDIDHVVPLKEAWISGADKWTKTKREQFANDPLNLLPVTFSANRSKGDSDVYWWMPPNMAYWRDYLTRWKEIKAKYGLAIDAEEQSALDRYLALDTSKEAAYICW